MSLILDALNKSEQERSERSNPVNIHNVHTPGADNDGRRRNRRWIWEAMVVVLILLAFYFYTQSRPDSQPVLPATGPVEGDELQRIVAPDSQPQQQVPAAAARHSAEPVSQPTEPVGQSVETVAQPKTAEESSAAIRQLYEQPDQPAAEVAPRSSSLAEQTGESVAPATAPPVTEDKNARWVKVPLIAQLSPVVKSSIPSIDFSVHMYSDKPQGSLVELNGQLLREGEQVAAGLRVVKIFEYGVILDYRGTQFRLLPLSGWINM